MIENRAIYLIFWILNEYIYIIGTRRVTYTSKYLIGSMFILVQYFLGLVIDLIRWISLQAKITLFVGQNLNAKTTLILGWRE